ncbi:formylglycine-generating enzyme family protein [Candidatus Poribacteria bacterium]
MLGLRSVAVFVLLVSFAIIPGCRDRPGSSWQGNVETKAITGRPTKKTSETKTGKDGAQMVLIPAGEFQMGSEDGWSGEKPAHTVYLDAFYMDRYEVTNALYRKFMSATGHKAPPSLNDDTYNTSTRPVVGVGWQDALAYAKWAGKRLPTEAEWEKAARGGLDGKKYPWGDKITYDNANYGGTGDKDKWDYTAHVGSFAPNGYGLYDMAGNVWEWCMDFYDENYYAKSPARNPIGPASGFLRVIRGGAWNSPESSLRVVHRNNLPPSIQYFVVGFRCVAQP